MKPMTSEIPKQVFLVTVSVSGSGDLKVIASADSFAHASKKVGNMLKEEIEKFRPVAPRQTLPLKRIISIELFPVWAII